MEFLTIIGSNNESLTYRFSKVEIREVVWDYECNNCLGLDDFNFNFIRKFYDIIRVEICRVVNCFHSRGRWSRGTNALFTSLLLKVEIPQGLQEYKPISLMGACTR